MHNATEDTYCNLESANPSGIYAFQIRVKVIVITT